jgi:deoxyribodipyrimidine photo-lyase
MNDTVIMWFRNDLRLADNAALNAAVRTGKAVVPIFILDKDAPRQWRPGGASRWWLDGSLAGLRQSLEDIGSRLVLARGPTRDTLLRIAHDVGAETIYCSRAYEPWAIQLEHDLKTALDADGIALKRYGGALLFEPETLRTKQGGAFQVYTPFARAAFAESTTGSALMAPTKLAPPKRWPKSDALAAWRLKPTKPDWASGLRSAWRPGEISARERLSEFLSDGIAHYHEQRDRPDLTGTSRLSPHLHYGEISVRQCWLSARAVADADPSSARGVDVFLKELLWREFSYHLLVHFPTLPDEPFRAQFARFSWMPDKRLVEAWQRGQTGYPIVDAGMRELWTTGWMHNRVRMITASFLVKHLLQPWQVGETWFWDTLVDADLASNPASWQWVTGSGADAAPYFRIFNPVTQAAKFDPDGAYVRRWCPELAKLESPGIHAPWTADDDTLAAAGIRLGQDYPRPIVDHMAARQRALAAFEDLKSGP